ncbi:MAG: hypothetical protein HGB20_08935 [Chlorobiaceae bacterium]|nr:hypothetical protein [Chlorobiaceae bacterium]
MSITIKNTVEGSVDARWPKPKVVQWLETGAIPALAGLWFPDWVGGYLTPGAGAIARFAFPPVLTYVGAVILFVACAQGVKHMGIHYRGVLSGGASAIFFAALSLVTHFLIPSDPVRYIAVTVGATVLALFSGTLFFWFTIAKVAEITTEARTYATAKAVGVLGIAALTSGLASPVLLLAGSDEWGILLRFSVVFTTFAFAFCRYGVHCYKTQKSIGASFAVPPDEQFWV